MPASVTAASSLEKNAVVIIGAGLAGLACARQLSEAEIPFILLEKSDRVGGRVQTDHVEGFLLDHGFQVLLTDYPTAQEMLDFEALDLQLFEPGAQVFDGGKTLQVISDPWRRPLTALKTLFSSVATPADKLKMLSFRQRLLRSPNALHSLQTPEEAEVSIAQALQREGFSAGFTQRFFEPFLRGVFLDPELSTQQNLFYWVMRLFATGYAALPAGGMQAIPKQLADELPNDCIRLNTKVKSVDLSNSKRKQVLLEDGTVLEARQVVFATEGPEASRLLSEVKPLRHRSTTCVYFKSPKPPITEPMLVLNGSGHGMVNNVCVPNIIAPSYAPSVSSSAQPEEQFLISASILGNPSMNDLQLQNKVKDELKTWFGAASVSQWEPLKTYRIKYALPDQTRLKPPFAVEAGRYCLLNDTDEELPGLYVAGDFTQTGSIEGALLSGKLAAQAVLEDFSRQHMLRVAAAVPSSSSALPDEASTEETVSETASV